MKRTYGKVTILIIALLLFIGGVYWFSEQRVESTLTFLDKELEEAILDAAQIEVDDSDPTVALRQIESLDLSDRHLTSLEGIEYLSNLRELNLSHNHIEDLSPLSKLRNLTSLDLSYNQLESIDSLQNPSLEHLSLEHNRLTDIRPVKELGHLQTLNMNHNLIHSLEPLTNLSYLKTLYAKGNQITSIDPLQQVTTLQALDISYNNITQLDPIANHTHLVKELRIAGNPIESIRPILSYADRLQASDIGELALFVDVSERGGIKDESVTVTLSLPYESEARIFYTLDGSTPDEHSTLYEEPITITENTVLSAVAILPDGTTGEEVRETYLFHVDHDLPVFSLSTDPDHLFDEEKGIYVPGVNFNRKTSSPSSTGNYAMRGREWEREAKLELFSEDHRRAFSQRVGIRIHGGESRANEQKSFRIYARDSYGNDVISYPLFGEEETSHFKTFLLRNSGNDYNKTFFRDGFLQELVRPYLNVETQLYEPAVLYVNGEYWGIYNIRERFDEDYFETVHGIKKENLDHIENNGEIQSGRSHEWARLMDYLREHDLKNDEHFAYVEEMIDIDHALDYFITQIYVRNTDWPGNNHQMYQDRTAKDSKWRWLLYDLDFGFGRFGGPDAYRHHSLQQATEAGNDAMPNSDWSTLVLRSLLENEAVKDQFIQRMMVYADSVFAPERIERQLDMFRKRIEKEMPAHMERWETIPSMEAWQSNIEIMKQFAVERPHYVRLHLADYFGLDGVGKVTMDAKLAAHLSVGGRNLCLREDTCCGTFYWMTNVALPLEYEGKRVQITSSNPSVAFVDEQSNTLTLKEEGEATLDIANEAGEPLGEIKILVNHYDITDKKLAVGEEIPLDGGPWLTSDEAIVAIDENDSSARAEETGDVLLTKKRGNSFEEIIRVQVTDDGRGGEE